MRNQKPDDYFLWLCNKVDCRDRIEYEDVLLLLYSTDFYSLVPYDDNRAFDGLHLRVEYYEETQTHIPRHDIRNHIPCNLLELILGVAIRMSYVIFDPAVEDEEDIIHYFWLLISNLRLEPGKHMTNSIIIERFLERQYKPNGEGGLFPLKYPKRNMKNIEIWYQMMEYITELQLISIE